ncbi:plasmid mobilization protein [Streptomyces sp. NPDC051218]|uniref:plasmid mobilization protein n=1 Tax=Streptomyces sp. NPDC051218 TaxID=3365645 RepID=UPI0037A66BD6
MDGAKPVQVLFTPDEYAAVQRNADQLGLTVDEFIRRAATVDATELPCPTAGTRRGSDAPVTVPPIRRSVGPDGAPALQRFLDTLAATAASGEPAPEERVPPQPTVRSCSGQ